MSMNPFVVRPTQANSWVVPVSVLTLILGAMISMAWMSDQNRRSRINNLDADQRARLQAGTIDLQEEYLKLRNQVGTLLEENTKLQDAIADQSKQGKVLNEGLQEAKLLAGLTEVEGPGVTVTLRDSESNSLEISPSNKVIHDQDVLLVVNELWAAGAEAITVNGHRVVGSTSFRCVGPVIHVDGIPIASPIVIRAIGDSKTLMGAMKMPFGVLHELRSMDEAMVQVDSVTKHQFPAYTGSTAKRFLTVPAAKK
jgi:uncharacterized protein YlxW (UPF0749 family)